MNTGTEHEAGNCPARPPQARENHRMGSRMRYFVVQFVSMFGLALAIAFTAQASPARAAEALTADTQLRTTGGATFTAPVGWSVTSAANKSVLEPPEADSHLA